MQIFLVGFMGSGKSTIGKKLATKLELPFIDLDDALEKQEDKSIADIFEQDGEPHFRKLERNWVEGLDNSAAVIALGGGTPCQEGIMDTLKQKGVTVYVQSNLGIIVSRLMNAKTKRPLIEEFKENKEKLFAFTEEKLNERKPYYFQSSILMNSSDINAEQISLLADLCTIKDKYQQSQS